MTIELFWVQISDPTLHQGDLLPRCLAPILRWILRRIWSRDNGRQSNTT